jgi:hypothetical protein
MLVSAVRYTYKAFSIETIELDQIPLDSGEVVSVVSIIRIIDPARQVPEKIYQLWTENTSPLWVSLARLSQWTFDRGEFLKHLETLELCLGIARELWLIEREVKRGQG